MAKKGESERTAAGRAATDVVLRVFRANGLLLAAGDELAANEGLTSARWQVLGAIALAEQPLTVPQIAREMGLARQSVHGTVARLAADGLVEGVPNPYHRRSRLVRLTDAGRASYEAMQRRQAAWVNRLSAGLRRSDLEVAAGVLDELCARLERDPNGNEA
jgi:DNA-binding MarR family transcriptional regulator